MSSPGLLQSIESKLRGALRPLHLDIVDESRRHAGHEGARGGGRHIAVTIVSTAFEGLPSVTRHRMIHRILADEMSGAIHALALAAHTPAEWDAGARDLPRATTAAPHRP